MMKSIEELRTAAKEFVCRAEIVKIIDGDSLRVSVDVGFTLWKNEDIRLARVNTPETRGSRAAVEGPYGRYVTDAVSAYVDHYGRKDVVIWSKEFKQGKYGRCICEVLLPGDDETLSDWLLDCGLGWPVDEGGSIIGPRNLDRLWGIEGSLGNYK